MIVKYVVVSTPSCVWCRKSEELIKELKPDTPCEKAVLMGPEDPWFRKIDALGYRSAPQIFAIHDDDREVHIGGYKELQAHLV